MQDIFRKNMRLIVVWIILDILLSVINHDRIILEEMNMGFFDKLKDVAGGAASVGKGALARNLRDQIRVLNGKLRQGGLSYSEEQHIREEIRRREEKLEELEY